MGCKRFVRPKDIVEGNSKLNMAFVCNLFNKYPCLEPLDEEIPSIEETREEKTFRNWMNSLGIKPYVHNLFTDLDDGIVLFQLFEKVKSNSGLHQFVLGVQSGCLILILFVPS